MLKQKSTRSLKTIDDEPSPLDRVIKAVFRQGNKSGKKQPADFLTIGGVYFAADDSETCDEATPQKSNQSLESAKTDTSLGSWKNSGSPHHNQGAPRLAKNFSLRRINPRNTYLSDSELAGRIAVASRSLPRKNEYFVSNHVMINDERIKRTIAPLKRIALMDELAREQAKAMAEEGSLFHSDPKELYEILVGQEPGRRIGQNVAKGESVTTIHKNMMTTESLADMNNLLDRRFIGMGIGTAKGADGTLYLCQIFRD